jgi:signal transduction histidine kinase/CheY-like chemotaxis protein
MRRDFFLTDLLQKERQSIKLTNETLEKIVLERTAELSKANKHLKDEISERKALEARLVQAQKMEAIGKLAGGIAHDFNNILFPIIGYTELLLRNSPEDNPFTEYHKTIHASALRAGNLVKQILVFSRQEPDNSKVINIQPVIKEALTLMRSTIPATIDIIQEIDSNCGPIKGDPTQIHQIIMNLATNAYHSMEKSGGVLRVNLQTVVFTRDNRPAPEISPGSYACISVSDTGSGMTREVEQKIFDPFFTTKAPGKGTGMGLSVVHGIVKQCNGFIQVSSKINHGTTILIYLPIKNALAIENTPPEDIRFENETRIPDGSGHIMVVDDEEMIMTLEKTWLEHTGYKVSAFSSSIDALKAFTDKPEQFDLVATDMNMPNLNGKELALKILQLRPDIPIMMCTGFSEHFSKEDAAAAGIKGYIHKPVILKDFTAKIRELLSE